MRGRLVQSAEKALDVMISIEGDDSRTRDAVVSKVEGLLRKIRDNEEIDVFINREESGGQVKMFVGIGAHEEKKAILDALMSSAKRSKGEGVKVDTEEIGKVSFDRRIAKSILAVSKQILAEEDEENFSQKLTGLRRGLREVWKNRKKPLRKFGIKETIRPNATIEKFIEILEKIGEGASSRGQEARALDLRTLGRGLMTLRSKKRKRLKNFGIEESIRPNTKVEEMFENALLPIIKLSLNEEVEEVEHEKARRELGQFNVGEDALPRGGFLEPVEKGLPEEAYQKGQTEEEIYAEAEEAQEQMLDWLDRGTGMDEKLGLKNVEYDLDEFRKPGRILLVAPPKGKERAREKVENEIPEEAGWSGITDIVRASIGVDSIDEIQEVMDELRKSGMKLAKKPKDRFSKPTGVGYRDILLNVEYPNGHIGELQIHLKPILLAKDAGHHFYQDVRKIEGKAKAEGRKVLTDEEQRVVDKANYEQSKLYDKAWRKSIGRIAKMIKALAFSKRKFFLYDGKPAKLTRNQFPQILVGDKFVRFYDFEKFHREAIPITEKQWHRELKKRA